MDRLGALGEEFDLGMKLSVTGAAVEPMMCGWLEILQVRPPPNGSRS